MEKRKSPVLISTVFIVLIVIVYVSVKMSGFNFIGEDYDGDPPNAILYYKDANQLAKANIHWDRGNKEYVDKEVKDIKDFALKQKELILPISKEIGIELKENDGGFNEHKTTVEIWNSDSPGTKHKLALKEGTIILPKEKGSYILEVNLYAEEGNVQYLGNLKLN
ncbi:hypothetical protein [Priestia megaterium]|uniref:hypothetical protein n=1 Tax=Priestia megaterium TaxID=1404 RepID=UPI00298C93CB|nr:hypothetical protein [Priestia megaterium]